MTIVKADLSKRASLRREAIVYWPSRDERKREPTPHDRREIHMTWKSDALVRKNQDIKSETKISGSRTILKSGRSYDQDQGSWRGYLSHTWAGLLATALPFHSLAGLSISFVVRTFLIGQRLIRLKIGRAWSDWRSCPNFFRPSTFEIHTRASDYQKLASVFQTLSLVARISYRRLLIRY